MSPPRVVLDTNAVVSALLFEHGRLAWLREKWWASAFVPVVDHDTAKELVRVLAYPKFRLSAAEQETLLADFLPCVETVAAYPPPANLPDIRDPHDVMFLALAKHARVDALVSGDADVLAVRGMLGKVLILTSEEFRVWLDSRNPV